MDYSIHVRTPSDEIYQRVVEALSPLGVEIVAGETDPLVMATFYLSRMNTKLDNLGQLRHLHKVVQNSTSVKQSLETVKTYYSNKNDELLARQRASIAYYRKKLLIGDDEPFVYDGIVPYLTFDEIDKLYFS